MAVCDSVITEATVEHSGASDKYTIEPISSHFGRQQLIQT